MLTRLNILTLPRKSLSVSGNSTCLLNEYKCQDGACIPFNYVCDDAADCEDGEDELDCSK